MNTLITALLMMTLVAVVIVLGTGEMVALQAPTCRLVVNELTRLGG